MTQTPSASAAVVPLDPNTEIDLSNPPAATPVQATKVEYTGTMTIAPGRPVARTYQLVTQLSALDMVTLQNAHQSGNFLEIIKSMQRLVVPAQREDLKAFLLSDPERDEDKITLDDCLRAHNDAMEQISARPTVKS